MHFRIVKTALGQMAFGWSEIGVARLMLPGDSAAAMRARLVESGGVEEPLGQGALAERLVAYADGAPDNFADIVVDLTGVSTFNRRIYQHIRGLAWGETTSYGAIARWLGDVAKSRGVGAAMGANPVPLIIPCHRVLAADGRTGGFSSPLGVPMKLRMLALERAAAPTGQYSFGF